MLTVKTFFHILILACSVLTCQADCDEFKENCSSWWSSNGVPVTRILPLVFFAGLCLTAICICAGCCNCNSTRKPGRVFSVQPLVIPDHNTTAVASIDLNAHQRQNLGNGIAFNQGSTIGSSEVVHANVHISGLNGQSVLVMSPSQLPAQPNYAGLARNCMNKDDDEPPPYSSLFANEQFDTSRYET